MTHYPDFATITEAEFAAVRSLTEKMTSQRIEVLDYWLDDHQVCIDVKFTTWALTTPVKCSFYGLTYKQFAAFYYTDSPSARHLLAELFESRYPK